MSSSVPGAPANLRLDAFAVIHQTLPAIHGTTNDILELSETDYAAYVDLVEKYSRDVQITDDAYDGLLSVIRSADFWRNRVMVAMDSAVSRQYFIEQLVRHRYLRHRVFLPTSYDDDSTLVHYVACDVDSGGTVVYAPEMPPDFRLLHDDVPTLRIMNDVMPSATVPFEDVYYLLDRPFYFGTALPVAWEDKTDALELQHEYDPAYFDVLFASDIPLASVRDTYVPPLLIHDLLLRDQRVALKNGDRQESAVAYVNSILPAASRPYRHWVQRSAVEAAYFLRRLFVFLSLRF